MCEAMRSSLNKRAINVPNLLFGILNSDYGEQISNTINVVYNENYSA